MKLSDFGITPEFSVENLKRAFGAFKTLVEKVKESASKREDVEKAVREEVLAYEDAKTEAEELANKIGEILYGAIDAKPFVAVHLADAMSHIAEVVETEADYAIDVETRKRLASLPQVDLSSDERAKLAEELRNMTNSIFMGCRMFGQEIPADVVPLRTDKDGKVKLNKDGNPEIAFPRLTTGTRKGGGGRKAKTAFWVYSWQAKGSDGFVKLDTSHIADVARNHVSSSTFRVTAKQVLDAMKGLVPPMTLEFQTGTLNVELPAEETSEEENNEG